MARLITKFKYLKPEDRKNVGGYAEYIATREGVEKIDESKRNAPATNKQKQLIKKILSDFPDSKSSLEYEDYLKEKTVGTASEFIIRALEENADEMLNTKTYADYIATRPRAERFGSHGLFTDDGVAVDLKKVSDDSMLTREMCGRQSSHCAVRMPSDSALKTAADGGICSGRKHKRSPKTCEYP